MTRSKAMRRKRFEENQHTGAMVSIFPRPAALAHHLVMLSRTGRKSPIYTLYSTNDLSATIVMHVKDCVYSSGRTLMPRILAKAISRVAPAVVLIRRLNSWG